MSFDALLPLAALMLANLQLALCQTLFTEDFPSPVGTMLTAAGWSQSGSSSTNPVSVAREGGLVYEGYSSSGLGNAATLTTTGQDVFHAFTPVTSGALYLSCMVEVQAAQSGDYFLALSKSTSQTNYFARLHVRSSGGGFEFGVSKSNEAAGAVYGTTVFSYNTCYLVIVKYTFVPSDSNDIVSVFAFTSPYLPGSEPGSPEVGPLTETSKPDAGDLGIVTLRQGAASSAPAVTVDGIKVATTWSEAPLPIQLSEFSVRALAGAGRSELLWSTVTETNSYGFQVQRSSSRSGPYEPISGLIAGHGTTAVRHDYVFIDSSCASPTAWYRLMQIDLDQTIHLSDPVGLAGTAGIAASAATRFMLRQNYPNPFNPSTRIAFNVEQTAPARLVVYNVLGEAVATLFDGIANAGREYILSFTPKTLPSGAYFCRLTSGSRSMMRRMLLLR